MANNNAIFVDQVEALTPQGDHIQICLRSGRDVVDLRVRRNTLRTFIRQAGQLLDDTDRKAREGLALLDQGKG